MSTQKRTREYFLNDQKFCTCCYDEWLAARRLGLNTEVGKALPKILPSKHIHAVIPGSKSMRDWITVCTPHQKKLRNKKWAREHGYIRDRRKLDLKEGRKAGTVAVYQSTPYERVVFTKKKGKTKA